MWLFGRPKSGSASSSSSSTIASATSPSNVGPAEQDVRAWRRHIQREIRGVEREVNKATMQEQRAIQECKRHGKANQVQAARSIAKEIFHIRKHRDRLYQAKARFLSLQGALATQGAMTKLSDCLKGSTVVMKAMNDVLNLNEFSSTMKEMTKEMEKAGVIEERMNDAIDSIDDSEAVDEAADAETERVLREVLQGQLMPVNTHGLAPVRRQGEAVRDSEKQEFEQFQSRLDQLRN